ncbi:hypothetical protein CLV62_11717 [Dysgonomonas alginatilytica]|uniref:Uncharacterized protein n=1 Tax=Dysgonomonas alginatilytica TaxID=1605892 RepID=A0A2V3PP03_9BACT|nr:hypothetical protein CLV62_11717 [Dysgonomonas alginatilytica]
MLQFTIFVLIKKPNKKILVITVKIELRSIFKSNNIVDYGSY